MDIVFESERILFIKVNKDLINDYLLMINDIKNQECISNNRRVYTYDDEVSWVEEKLNNNELVFSMIDKTNNNFIGNIEIMTKKPIGTIGICLSNAYQNKHYGTEALKRLIEYGYSLGYKLLDLYVYKSNLRAIKCYLNVGFIHYGTRSIDEYHMVYKDNKIDEIYLELQDNEWEYEYTNNDRVIVRGIVYDDNFDFYFVHVNRNDDFGDASYIETSGGGVEEDEDLISAITRELSEELGASVDVIAKIGTISDYYNLIHRHNINNYFLCKLKTIGKSHMTEDEIDKWHLSMVKMNINSSIKEYEKNRNTKIGRLVYNREVPILLKVKEILSL